MHEALGRPAREGAAERGPPGSDALPDRGRRGVRHHRRRPEDPPRLRPRLPSLPADPHTRYQLDGPLRHQRPPGPRGAVALPGGPRRRRGLRPEPADRVDSCPVEPDAQAGPDRAVRCGVRGRAPPTAVDAPGAGQVLQGRGGGSGGPVSLLRVALPRRAAGGVGQAPRQVLPVPVEADPGPTPEGSAGRRRHGLQRRGRGLQQDARQGAGPGGATHPPEGPRRGLPSAHVRLKKG